MKKQNLPESLELLLDTMCNTFGGIMFIAISLVVISQFTAKKIADDLPAPLDPKAAAELPDKIATLKAEITGLQNTATKPQSRNGIDNPQEIKQLEEELASYALNDAKERELREALVAQAKIKQELAEEARELARQGAPVPQPTGDNATVMVLQNQVAVLTEKLDAEKKKAAARPTRAINFAVEKDTNLDQFIVLIKENQIYRQKENFNEVRMEENESINSIRMYPRVGRGHGFSPADCKKIFSAVDNSKYYIDIWIDKESFAALYQLRQWLRQNSFKMRWNVNDGFSFSRGGNGRASD